MSALYSQYAQADLREQCLLGVPQFHGEAVDGNMNDQPIYIDADKAVINQPTDATYTGDVNIKQGNRTLIADEVRVEQKETMLQLISPQKQQNFQIQNTN